MAETPDFQPDEVQSFDAEATAGGDSRDGRVYVYHNDNIALAVKVALVTGRPLLLGGPSGSGKSTLARNVALKLGWRYYEHVVTSRTEARDFLYRFDAIRRLNDAQVEGGLLEVAAYIEPGVLWWAFNRNGAIRRGSNGLPQDRWAADPSEINPASERAVVLIDEIDKADVDVPNNLLVPLGSLQFSVEPVNIKVTAQTDAAPLVFVTTNRERELPLAFLRRCVTLDLDKPGPEVLVKIARAHFPRPLIEKIRERAKKKTDAGAGEAERRPLNEEELFAVVARRVLDMDTPDERAAGLPPSTAEYIDTVRACLELGIQPGDRDFDDLARITLRKRQSVQGAMP
jgi:MoxR-like ATPase